jgi:hypothetical protein
LKAPSGRELGALNCFVIEGGEITVDDEVQLVHGHTCTSPQRPLSSPTNNQNLSANFFNRASNNRNKQ